MKDIYVYRNKNLHYPKKGCAFSPSIVYPEYKWLDDPSGISKENNTIYSAVREIFHELKLDQERFNTKDWNPLEKLISPGDTVLIKPNMVKHVNDTSDNGTECLYTNPSLVRAVLDYVLIAQRGRGRIVIADSPVQSCDFDELYLRSGYSEVIEFYRQHQVNIEVYDLRREIASIENGIVVRRKNVSTYEEICIDLAKKSAFCDLTEQQLKNLRITDYSPDIMNKHHTKEKHEYSISKIAIEADVIINMPKIKTHRLGGITAALKNIVGINSRKDYLPHHRIGSTSEGGDQFEKNNVGRILTNKLSDRRNQLIENRKYKKARITDIFYRGWWKIFRLSKSKDASIGNWYGNDTVWRMVDDLNRIVLFSDKLGKICESKQRKMMIIGDMVVAGEGEGPLNPQPIGTNCIIMGSNPLLFDMTVSKLMGYAYRQLPIIKNSFLMKKEYEYFVIKSNNQIFDGKKINELTQLHYFKRPNGWKEN